LYHDTLAVAPEKEQQARGVPLFWHGLLGIPQQYVRKHIVAFFLLLLVAHMGFWGRYSALLGNYGR
jgi:hypothetical protein